MEQLIDGLVQHLAGQGPVVIILVVGLYYLWRVAESDRKERQEAQKAFIDLFKEINTTLNEHTKVVEGLSTGFQIIVNHILNGGK